MAISRQEGIDIGEVLEAKYRAAGGRTSTAQAEDIFLKLTRLAGTSYTSSALKVDIFNEALSKLSVVLSLFEGNVDKLIAQYKDSTGIYGLLNEYMEDLAEGMSEKKIGQVFKEMGDVGPERLEEFNRMLGQSSKEMEDFGEVVRKQTELIEEVQTAASDFVGEFRNTLTRIPLIGGLFGKGGGAIIGSFQRHIIEPIFSKFQKIVETRLFMPLESAAAKIGPKIAKLLTNPYLLAITAIGVATIGFLAYVSKQLQEITGSLAQELGITYGRAERLGAEIVKVGRHLMRYDISLEDVLDTAIALSFELETMNLDPKLVESTAKIQKAFGLSADEAAKLQATLIHIAGIDFKNIEQLEEMYVAAAIEAERLAIPHKVVIQNLAASVETMSMLILKTRQQRIEFAKQVALATKLKETLDGLKNLFAAFNDPLEAMRKMNAIAITTGVQINAQEVFALRIRGKHVEAMNVVLDQIEKQRSLISDNAEMYLKMRIWTEQLGVEETKLVELIERRKGFLEDEERRRAGIFTFEEKLRKMYREDFGLAEKVGPFKRMWLDIKSLLAPILEQLQPMAIVFVKTLYEGWRLLYPILNAVAKSIAAILWAVNKVFGGIDAAARKFDKFFGMGRGATPARRSAARHQPMMRETQLGAISGQDISQWIPSTSPYQTAQPVSLGGQYQPMGDNIFGAQARSQLAINEFMRDVVKRGQDVPAGTPIKGPIQVQDELTLNINIDGRRAERRTVMRALTSS